MTRLDGRLAATPLLAALVVVEVTDVIFAVDSVPAIFAVSNEPFLVFSSNAFAILGLRAMYFLVNNAKQRSHYLSHALGAILIFVGVKMTISSLVPHEHLPLNGDHRWHPGGGDGPQPASRPGDMRVEKRQVAAAATSRPHENSKHLEATDNDTH